MTTKSRVTHAVELRTLQAGIASDLPDAESVIVGGVTFTKPELNAKIDEFLLAQTNTVSAKNAYHTAVDAERTSNAKADAFREQMQGVITGRFGKENPVLAKFGFTPSTPRKISTATKAVAALKVKATRAARGTKGRVERAKIKGSVDPAVAAALRANSADSAEEVDAAK